MSTEDLWVFGYGSLMWNPGFEYKEAVVATLAGYHRSFCMRSIHHRGTQDVPGLVLALDERQGATCHGVGFLACPKTHAQTMADLRDRELVSSAYLEKRFMITLKDGRRVEAVSYVIDPDHVQYCNLELEEQAQIIARAVGGRGPNTEYLFNTASQLTALGIEDDDLSWLSKRVGELVDT